MSISAVAMCEGGATVYGRVWYQNVQQSRRAPHASVLTALS